MRFHYGTRKSIMKGLNLRDLDTGFGMKGFGYYLVMNEKFDVLSRFSVGAKLLSAVTLIHAM